MFAIRVTYLMGRVYSSLFEDGDSKEMAEWPPHPSRLFSALVSAWGDGGAEDELRPALEWIERQEAPAVYAGAIFHRSQVQSFVPVNDSAKLPEDRSRKPRAFPSATLADPDVFFVWSAEPPDDITSAIRILLGRTSSLGHSASLIEADVAQQPGSHENAWMPDEKGEIRMRIPYQGRFEELRKRYALFQSTPEKIFRPTAGESALYTRPRKQTEPVARGSFDQMIVLKRLCGPKASLRSTLSLTMALRGAILANADEPIPEYLSGHAPQSTTENPVRSERTHVALVPTPFVDFGHATGEVMGLAVVLPRNLTRDERIVCWDVAGRIKTLRLAWGDTWEVEVTDAEERRKALRTETWTRPCRVWSTVTPFVFDRFPKDPYGAEAEQIVRGGFGTSGFPAPVEIELHYNPWHTGVPKASAFAPTPARAGRPQRFHCHVRAVFEQAVAGPMIAGAGRYYGYGLFRQLRDKEQG